MTQFTTPWDDRRPRRYRGLRGALVEGARLIASLTGPLLFRHAAPIFFGGIISGVIAVWVVAELSARYLGDYPLVRMILAVVGVTIFVSLIPLYAIWWERKVAGRIQSRTGPMRVGGWHGSAQSFADGIKLVTKEDLVPGHADKPLFLMAPYLTLIPVVVAFLVLPFGSYWVMRTSDAGLVFILGALGVEVVGVILAGWSSNSKWTVYGAMREACQMVSYEIPLGLALLLPIMTIGTLDLSEIAETQSGGWHTWIVFRSPFLFAAAAGYYTASLASCKRAPFDLPESESELVAGFLTEYSGIRWALFFFAEYVAMYIVSALAVILFFGGWYSGLPVSWGAGLGEGVFGTLVRGLVFGGPVIFVVKCFLLIYVQMWVRWTLPRIRIDQVFYACVQVLLPLMMVLLLCHTLWELWVAKDGILWRISNAALATVGGLILFGCLVVIVGARLRSRALVGRLAVDLLPGS